MNLIQSVNVVDVQLVNATLYMVDMVTIIDAACIVFE